MFSQKVLTNELMKAVESSQSLAPHFKNFMYRSAPLCKLQFPVDFYKVL
jgi:hypothetical protein